MINVMGGENLPFSLVDDRGMLCMLAFNILFSLVFVTSEVSTFNPINFEAVD